MGQHHKKPSLGRGLSALLGESIAPNMDNIQKGTIELLSPQLLKPGAYQPRSLFDDEKLESLIESIREKGIIQPLVVRKLENSNLYEIIAGERRWRAAKTLDFSEVPVIVRECSDTEALELALIENIQRDDLNPLEEAEAYQKLITQFGHTQEHIAKSVGKSRSYIANMIRLNNLSPSIKTLIIDGKISAGHARALLSVENSEELAQDIISKNLNVREVERVVKQTKNPLNKSVDKSEDILSLEQQLQNLFKAHVDIHLKNDRGMIQIHFKSFEELDDIIQRVRFSE